MNNILLISLLFISAFSFMLIPKSSVPPNPPITVPYVNITQYLGTWYQQASIPFYFQRNCIKTSATYSLNKNGSIRVDNKCQRNGKVTQSVGHAVPEDQTNSKLKVEFIATLDIGGQYWVVRLGQNYEYSVVTTPTYNLLWILYRQPVMPDSLYQNIIFDLANADFPIDKLRKTPQV